MGAPAIKTGWKTTYPANYARDREGFLYVLNGFDRPILWDGYSALAFKAGIDYPSVTAVGDGTAGSITGVFLYGAKLVDLYGRESELDVHSVTTSANTHFDWTWQDITAQNDRVRFIDLYRSTTDQSTTVYKVVRLGTHGTIDVTASNGAGTPKCRFTINAGHFLQTGAEILVEGHPAHNGLHQVTRISATIIDTDIGFTTAGTGTWSATAYRNTDNLTDAALELLAPLAITNPDGTINARRQGVPPNELAVAAWFQDRMFYAVTRKYSTGTIATTVNVGTLTGTGTAWITEFAGRGSSQADTEWLIQIENEPKPLRVTTFSTATSMAVDAETLPTLTQSGKTYILYPDPKIFRNRLFFSEIDEGESVPYDAELGYVNVIPIQENTGDDDEITGLMPYGYALWVLKERHLYRMTFNRQPEIDAGVSLVASRGCLNHRCWSYHEGLAYLMDSAGIYAFDGSSIEPISGPIQDKWRDGTIDMSLSRWFFAVCDTTQELVRFYVKYTADTGTYPKRAFVWDVRNKAWWLETYPFALGGGCTAEIAGIQRVLVGSADEVVYKTNQGFDDAGTAIACAWKSGLFPFADAPAQQAEAVQVAFQPTEVAAALNAQLYFDNATTAKTAEIDHNLGDGVTWTAGSSNIAIAMLRTASSLGDQSGWRRFLFGGRREPNGITRRWMGLGLTGTAPTTEQVKIYAVMVEGVKGGR